MASILQSMTRYAQLPVKYFSLYLGNPQPRGLAALPLELLTEIMKELEWRDILYVRQTCRRLSDASKARPVWLNLFKTYSEHLLFPLQLEGPLENYSASQLEDMILRWKRAERSYAMDSEIVDGREIEIALDEDQHVNIMHLVKGGRWLLLVLSNGSIRYCDLECEDVVSHPLVPHPFNNDETEAIVRFSIDMLSTPTLTFNIAIAFRDVISDEAINFLQVWQVSVVLDGQGRGMELQSCLLSFFVQSSGGQVPSLSISGQRLAYSFVTLDRRLPCYVFVVHWPSVDSLTTPFPQRMFTVPVGMGEVCLLPDHKLLLASSQYFHLLDWMSVDESTTPLSSTMAPADFLWSHRVGYWNCILGDAFACVNSTRFVFECDGIIRGLVIEHPSPNCGHVNEPYFVKLMEYPETWDKVRKPCRVLGYNHAFGLGGDRGLTILRYSWPGEPRPDFPSVSLPAVFVKMFDSYSWDGAGPCIDLGTGRVVALATFRNRLLFFDIPSTKQHVQLP
ncbi:unnamed protein product [Cyclocybe aegerita]|uniref:F-box domain-containing protein n=1 Tax=Cyclocybe aegerita TaxID=1973307 RepID=A0A8S0X6N6_CYCAE|nr:unnamed protein product [Cyclocybe aegerita]